MIHAPIYQPPKGVSLWSGFGAIVSRFFSPHILIVGVRQIVKSISGGARLSHISTNHFVLASTIALLSNENVSDR